MRSDLPREWDEMRSDERAEWKRSHNLYGVERVPHWPDPADGKDDLCLAREQFKTIVRDVERSA